MSVELCTWCPDPMHPDPKHHPDGQCAHIDEGLSERQKDKLLLAFDQALAVYNELKPQKSICECCGVAKYDDADLWHQKQMLGAAVGRLEKVVKWKEKGTQQFQPED